MLPIILVTKNKDEVNHFLQKFIKENKIANNSIYSISPKKKEILISQLREIKKEIMLTTPFNRLIVIYSFDAASEEAQNTLLKSLEESILKNQFILVVENEHSVLPTIRSRSKMIKLKQRQLSNYPNSDFNQYLSEVEKSNNYRFLSSKFIDLDKDEINDFFLKLIVYYRGRLILKPLSAIILKKTLKLRTLIESNNLNSKFALDSLLIFINKVFKMKE
ncbi:hypothetical protein A3C98_00150 [Candidatus Roizmanbacteria bacterium RIFCSPHIGHO2_02_FULL_37_15]|uniref:DNA polymerase III delta N-terminal domain-containing protein n=1 Tax=Candidatus Roizmanbacteria bacterium RIFCSPLOWO2_01_FULL_37_16 TaxID=1802058 RepID=A0A1F7IKS3_9BACT|nr:MAG: hypothetical protein A2859_04665 [Candidatus Roizmanbacteria bacterium RIFCSPHIGHO2_01_FULL_37_16b]OGK22289.1 MAG: hypothetical protein A3C98_00150 [Candidatus Roizmanbacteria bacterium RIFCSPHIGHO2_02_FULL_37_15]OGK31802.1 MAG: hypothetical protein A3F57_00475 [Candidatus Roizmanbacteria bacterium RIFCSPHIGHO2_12_FULL_36_11]OGK43961.1 MAG: hypothetical protein A3B40_04110 [Candidatus Roizmanbacteria bacterium RIFCSPLOWO2_01_FULL_37_16]OGK56453.1 MAG: hypothetical protein A3I50_00435 [C